MQTNKIAPQVNYFRWVILLKKYSGYLFYVILIVSILLPFVSTYSICGYKVKPIIECINYLSIIMFGGFVFINDFYFVPNAENVRRKDFIDNSFGSKLSESNSEGYYSNDKLNNGIYKAAVNLFENCFFTLNISRKMRLKEVVKSTFFSVIIIIFAIKGFSNNEMVMPFLQVLVSAPILGEMIKLLFFVSRTEDSFKELQNLFAETTFKKNTSKYIYKFLKVYLDYETNISWGMILLDNKIYNQLNPILSKDWEKIKIKYDI